MSAEKGGTDREMTEIAQSLEFMAEDFRELSEKLDGQTRNDYLGVELRSLYALLTNLNYNIDKLEKLTGQFRWMQETFPF